MGTIIPFRKKQPEEPEPAPEEAIEDFEPEREPSVPFVNELATQTDITNWERLLDIIGIPQKFRKRGDDG